MYRTLNANQWVPPTHVLKDKIYITTVTMICMFNENFYRNFMVTPYDVIKFNHRYEIQCKSVAVFAIHAWLQKCRDSRITHNTRKKINFLMDLKTRWTSVFLDQILACTTLVPCNAKSNMEPRQVVHNLSDASDLAEIGYAIAICGPMLLMYTNWIFQYSS